MASINIKITKEIYAQSKYCGLMVNDEVQGDCAIQKCIKQIFPDALVEYDFIHVYLENEDEPVLIDLPDEAIDLIKVFDRSNPNERAAMKELEFSIDIPEALLSKIDLSEINDVLTTKQSTQAAQYHN